MPRAAEEARVIIDGLQAKVTEAQEKGRTLESELAELQASEAALNAKLVAMEAQAASLQGSLASKAANEGTEAFDLVVQPRGSDRARRRWSDAFGDMTPAVSSGAEQGDSYIELERSWATGSGTQLPPELRVE
eukprot:1137215-Prymnesium_polylepis.2